MLLYLVAYHSIFWLDAPQRQSDIKYILCDEAEPLLLEAVKGRRLKLGDTHPHTLESLNNLIELYEAWNKPEEAEEWRAKLPQKKAVEQ